MGHSKLVHQLVVIAAIALLLALAIPGPPAQGAVMCKGHAVTIKGTPGKDNLRGTPGPDVIAGLGGDDVIRGRGGNDIICGGGGNDVLIGYSGADESTVVTVTT
jgi:hypothetical protein